MFQPSFDVMTASANQNDDAAEIMYQTMLPGEGGWRVDGYCNQEDVLVMS